MYHSQFPIDNFLFLTFSSVQSLSRVWLFATPWTAAHQASLSINNSWSLLKLMSIELVMPSNHLILCCPLLLLLSIFASIRVFSNESGFSSGGQTIGVSASASVLPMNIQDWFLDILAVQGTLRSPLQHHSSKASILRRFLGVSKLWIFFFSLQVLPRSPLSLYGLK